MQTHDFARIGLVLAPEDPCAPYYREVLEHAGIPHEVVSMGSLEHLDGLDVLLLCGSGELMQTHRERVHSWLRLGGSLLCSGSSWGLEDDLGIRLELDGSYPAREIIFPSVARDRSWPEKAGPARFFGGVNAKSTDASAIAQTASGTLGASRRKLGRGHAYFLCPHLGQTMHHMQLGIPVEGDGLGPNDGSARLDDARNRAEDGIVLDWDRDRSQPENAAHPLFTSPHADIVRDLWIRLVLEACEAAGCRVVMVWPWPNDAEGGACLSVDCEEFSPTNVVALHNIMAMAGAPAAWMVAQPGYSLDVYRTIRKWEHEIGMLFAPDENGGLNEERLKIHHVAITRVASVPAVASLRLPDGGWYRHLTLYDLAEATGSRASLCKGGRQPGTSGFAFGTCHPFHPVRADGTMLRVLEIPYQIFMPGLVIEEPAVMVLVEQAAARHGCLHAVVSSPAAQDQRVALILRRTITLAKQAKLEFMLPGEIARVEKARRAIRIKTWRDGDAYGLNLVADDHLEDLTLMVSGPPVEAQANGKTLKPKVVRRYGMEWTSLVMDLVAKSQVGVVLSEPKPESLAA